MWLSEAKLKGKTGHFRLPSASQKRVCLSSLMLFLWGGGEEGRGVVQKVDYTIHWINHYPVDKSWQKQLAIVLSSG